MGIQNFSKTFNATRQVKITNMSNTTVAIDGMTELWRAALGAKSVHALTDQNGKPTMHINVILSVIMDFYKNNVNQYWVFDHNQITRSNKEFHNMAKLEEVNKRRLRKDVARAELDNLTMEYFKKSKEISFDYLDDLPENIGESSSSPSNSVDNIVDNRVDSKVDNIVDSKVDTSDTSGTTGMSGMSGTLEDLQAKKDMLEKRAFTVTSDIIDDIILILNALGIKWIEAPEGFEGEAVCTDLVLKGKATAVYSGDTDPIAFGTPILWRKCTRDKIIYEYTNSDLFKQIKEANVDVQDPNLEDLRKICVMLGTDFCKKSPKIGPKTVIKKFNTTEISDEQKEAIQAFNKMPRNDSYVIHNDDARTMESEKIEMLINWLVLDRSFSKDRINGIFTKANAYRDKLLNKPKKSQTRKVKTIK